MPKVQSTDSATIELLLAGTAVAWERYRNNIYKSLKFTTSMLTCHPELIFEPKRFVEVKLVVEITADERLDIENEISKGSKGRYGDSTEAISDIMNRLAKG